MTDNVLTKTKYLLESSADRRTNEEKSIQKESDRNEDRKEVIIWLEDDMDGRTLRRLMQDCIDATMEFAKERVTVENNESVKANDHWHKIIEGIKCLPFILMR